MDEISDVVDEETYSVTDLLSPPDTSQRHRPFVAGLLVEELCEDPSLLTTWCEAFAPHYVTSLKMVAVGDAAAAEAAVLQALTASGMAADDERDLELQICREADEVAHTLVGGVRVMLTRRRLDGALAGIAATADVAVLRTMAVDWWAR